MDKLALPLTQFVALVMTGIVVIYILNIPVDKAHTAAITGTAIIVFTVTNFVTIVARRAGLFGGGH
jgi:hypothetical protein